MSVICVVRFYQGIFINCLFEVICCDWFENLIYIYIVRIGLGEDKYRVGGNTLATSYLNRSDG